MRTEQKPDPTHRHPVAHAAKYLLILLTAGCLQTTGIRGQQSPPPDAGLVTNITTILDPGGRLDWCRKTGELAVDLQGEDDFFDVWVMNADGSNRRCLTCDHPGLPGKHNGNPAWHPSGKFIAFQAQNDYKGLGYITDWFGNPGAGLNNDLYLMNVDTRELTRITEVEPKEGGVLHPQFSRAGDQILWAERLNSAGIAGEWALKVGDVKLKDGKPEVSNIRTFRPGAQKRFYESHDFSPDGKSILFSGDLEEKSTMGTADVYRLHLADEKLERLTSTMEYWDEHAHYSPSGKTILWMSGSGVGKTKGASAKTDYWIMNADGTNKRRLTYFNEEGHPHYIPKKGAIAADAAWSADGKSIIGYLILSFRPHRAINVLIELSEAQ